MSGIYLSLSLSKYTERKERSAQYDADVLSLCGELHTVYNACSTERESTFLFIYLLSQ